MFTHIKGYLIPSQLIKDDYRKILAQAHFGNFIDTCTVLN